MADKFRNSALHLVLPFYEERLVIGPRAWQCAYSGASDETAYDIGK